MNTYQSNQALLSSLDQELVIEELSILPILGDDFLEEMGVSQDEWENVLDYIAEEQVLN